MMQRHLIGAGELMEVVLIPGDYPGCPVGGCGC
jgi:hypothetical protein